MPVLPGETLTQMTDRNIDFSVGSASPPSRDLEERLRFETLLTDLSSRFVNVPPDRVDEEIKVAQRAICDCLGVDHSSVWQAAEDDPGTMVMTHIFRDPTLNSPPERMTGTESFPWVQEQVLRNQIVAIPRTKATPPEAAIDQQSWRSYGIKSALVIPLSAGGGPVFGVLSFEATGGERDWPDTLQKRLHVLAEVFANALARKQADQQLRESEARLREGEARLNLAADSANAGLWTLDPVSGEIWATQKTYQLLGLAPETNLDVSGFLAVVHPDDKAKVQDAIEDAMQSGKERAAEYRVVLPDGSIRWLAARGRRQPGENGRPDRLMGVNIDITEGKRNEQELAELRARLEAESEYLKEEIRVHGRFEEIVGQSEAIRRVFQRIEQVAETDAIVLITGETGTGKELVARAIHSHSRRKHRVIVKVDCTSLPPTLIENELFGREKGAYTGALARQLGRFEVADGSTLFLDEIGELPLELQTKLLRAVQEGKFERLGNPRPVSVDVRIIAATHRDLAAKVKDGSFRQDLYYRLNVFSIHVPPLRDRVDDIPLLTWTFVRELERKMGKKFEHISKKTMDALFSYAWPGNVRELRNAIEQAMILSPGDQLKLQLPKDSDPPDSHTLKQAEYQHIMTVLESTGWRIKGPRGAAERLGMNPSTLFSTMRRLGIPSKPEKV